MNTVGQTNTGHDKKVNKVAKYGADTWDSSYYCLYVIRLQLYS